MILIRISSISIYEGVKSWHIKKVKYNSMVKYNLFWTFWVVGLLGLDFTLTACGGMPNIT